MGNFNVLIILYSVFLAMNNVYCPTEITLLHNLSDGEATGLNRPTTPSTPGGRTRKSYVVGESSSDSDSSNSSAGSCSSGSMSSECTSSQDDGGGYMSPLLTFLKEYRSRRHIASEGKRDFRTIVITQKFDLWLSTIKTNTFNTPIIEVNDLIKLKTCFDSKNVVQMFVKIFENFINKTVEKYPKNPICFRFATDLELGFIITLLGNLQVDWPVNKSRMAFGEIFLDHPRVMPLVSTREACEAVAIVILVVYPETTNNYSTNILVEKVSQNNKICHVGGLINAGETVLSAIKSELREELSSTLSDLVDQIDLNENLHYLSDDDSKFSKKPTRDWQLILKKGDSFSNERVSLAPVSPRKVAKTTTTHVFYLFINGDKLNIKDDSFFDPTDLKEVSREPVAIFSHDVDRNSSRFLYPNAGSLCKSAEYEWKVLSNILSNVFRY